MSTNIEDIKFGVTIAAPGDDSNTYILFDSIVAFGAGQMPTKGIDRITVALNNSQAITFKSQYLRAGTASTYDDNQTTGSLAIGAGATGSPYDFVVVGLGDIRIVAVNGGTAQANWPPVVTGIRGQKQAST